MCIEIKRKPWYMRIFGENPKVAKKDIKCWKVLNKDFTAQYRNYKYSPGLQPKVEMGITKCRYTMYGDVGYHSFTTESFARDECNSNEIVVEFTIPKGTKYYIGYYTNINDNYISEQIKL